MKIKQNAKYLFTTIEGDHFIYFQNKKAALLIEITEHENLAGAKKHLQETSEHFAENNFPFLASMTNVDLKFYSLIATRVFELSVDNSEDLQSTMKRLADWYRYTYLIPVIQGKMPLN